MDHLRRVFRCLAEAYLLVKLGQCRFGYEKAKYLGHVIGQRRIEPDEERTFVIRDYPTPVTKKDVRRAFVGLIGYYR